MNKQEKHDFLREAVLTASNKKAFDNAIAQYVKAFVFNRFYQIEVWKDRIRLTQCSTKEYNPVIIDYRN